MRPLLRFLCVVGCEVLACPFQQSSVSIAIHNVRGTGLGFYFCSLWPCHMSRWYAVEFSRWPWYSLSACFHFILTRVSFSGLSYIRGSPLS
ncbi:hypothetical protein C8R44DRAFT_793240 [Mycena epipterygia]|nr:hypothetical protein C8R44DRAFT_793240 [Mycena epipterygia]